MKKEVIILFGIILIVMISSCAPKKTSETSLEEATKEEKVSPLQANFNIVKNEIDYWEDKDDTIGHEHYERLAKQMQEFEDSGISKDEIDSYKEKLENIKFKGQEKAALDIGDDEEIIATEKPEETSRQEEKTLQGPAVNTWVLPFEVSDSYDAKTKSLGDVSFAGSWVAVAFGEDFGEYDNPDVWFELVPGTVLKATYSGQVSVQKNWYQDPEGELVEADDYEVFIHFEDGHWIEYDHVVEPMVSDQDFVEIGQSLGKAAPAWMRHGDPVESKKPVDEIEWGLRKGGRVSASVCPFKYLKGDEQEKWLLILETMKQQGFESPEKLCLKEEVS